MTRYTDRYSDHYTDRTSGGSGVAPCSQRVESRGKRVEGRGQRVEVPPLTRAPQGALVLETVVTSLGGYETNSSLKVDLRPRARIAGAEL